MLHGLQPLGLDHIDGQFGQVANDGFHIAPDIADLGELRRFDLDEGGFGQLGQPSGDFRLAHAGRADHDDVLRHHLVAEVGRDLLTAPAVAKGDGDHPLGILLPDDVAIQLLDDLTRGETIEIQRFGIARERLHNDALSSKFFNNDLLVGVNVNGTCDVHGFGDDHRGLELGMA